MSSYAEARIAAHAVAHHDIWWAKSAMWSSATSAILLIAAFVSVDQIVQQRASGDQWVGWRLFPLVVLVTVLCHWYLVNLHRFVVTNRRNARRLRVGTNLEQVYDQLLGQSGPCSDASRGCEFLLVMMLAISVAAGIATYLLTNEKSLGAAVWYVTWLAGVSRLALIVNRALGEIIHSRKSGLAA